MFGVFTGYTRGIRREPTTSKTQPRGWYKGKGVRSIGWIDDKAKFHFDWKKVYSIEAPDLTDFELKPYVSRIKPQYIKKKE